MFITSRAYLVVESKPIESIRTENSFIRIYRKAQVNFSLIAFCHVDFCFEVDPGDSMTVQGKRSRRSEIWMVSSPANLTPLSDELLLYNNRISI
jgi:hypothetical protein